jgi:hypothetical protein
MAAGRREWARRCGVGVRRVIEGSAWLSTARTMGVREGYLRTEGRQGCWQDTAECQWESSSQPVAGKLVKPRRVLKCGAYPGLWPGSH